MAVMIPDFLPECVRSDGEERLFNKLKQSTDTNGWLVFHSLKLGKHISRIEGEIDMVIVVPEVGVLRIEVKACRKASREERSWTLGNSTTKDPFQQADSATRTLRDLVSSTSAELGNVLFTYAVFFTHTVPVMESDQKPLEWRNWQLIDAIQFETSEISTLILSILKKERNKIYRRLA